MREATPSTRCPSCCKQTSFRPSIPKRPLSLTLTLNIKSTRRSICKRTLVQEPAATAAATPATAAATPAAAAAVPSGAPIELASVPLDQQLELAQQNIEIAERQLQLAQRQFSSLESLSKQLATPLAQSDAAATFSKTQADIAAAVPAAVPAVPEAVPAAVPEVKAAFEAAAANIGAVDAASVPYGQGGLADAAGAADAAAAVQATALQATALQATALGIDAAAQTAQAAQAALGTEAAAQTAQAAAVAEAAGFDLTPILIVGAFLPIAFAQYNELMSVPRVTGDSANSGGGPLPGWASLAAYADSKNRGPEGEGRSAPQIVYHALVNLEQEARESKGWPRGWLYGGQKDWNKGYVFRQAAAPSALYSTLPDAPSADAAPTASAEAPAAEVVRGTAAEGERTLILTLILTLTLTLALALTLTLTRRATAASWRGVRSRGSVPRSSSRGCSHTATVGSPSCRQSLFLTLTLTLTRTRTRTRTLTHQCDPAPHQV